MDKMQHGLTQNAVAHGWNTLDGQAVRWLTIAIGVAASLIAPTSSAQVTGANNPSGGRFVAVDDGVRRQCININTSVVSMFLLGVKARTHTSWLPPWLSSSRDLGVKVNITMTDPLTQNPTFTFPRAVKLKASGTTNIVTLPIVYQLLTKYSFINSSNNPPSPISNISLDIDFINIEKATALATTILSLIDFSKNLPVPPNPYSTGAQLFGQFANTLIQQAAAGSADAAPLATISYDLSTLDGCGSRELREGTTALIIDYSGQDMDGVIATSDAEKYCYYYSEATREVTYAAKPQPAQDCSQPTLAGTPRKPLNNPQIVYSVNSYARPGTTVAVRAPPSDAPKAAITLDNSAIARAAQQLQQERLGYDGDVAKAQGNIRAFGQALGEGLSGLPPELQGESHDQSLVRLPASRAIEYDTARAIARCQRIGVSLDQCI
jgi:hypothetical protein